MIPAAFKTNLLPATLIGISRFGTTGLGPIS